ncbi:MAG: excinuclease ABC subunit UvrA [Parachlamydiaceae bacterium]|nr:excinuclease ABC subunit UvrA [Parachlamydiaceae bacterium]
MQPSSISLRGCRQHNLKNISLSIPKQSIIAIVGVSGSGKSSLAFDTLFAEGQRRYLEYLSPQARSWIKQMPKPDVDLIEGLSPTLAIGQGRQTLYSRGIVATYTDIYDFLALLYANIGEQHSPATGKKLTRYSRQEIIELILKEYPTGSRIQLLSPIKLREENPHETIHRLQRMGFIRLRLNQQEWTLEDTLPTSDSIKDIDVVVDRLAMKEDVRERLTNSVETAMDLSQGVLKVIEGNNGAIKFYTEIFVCPETGMSFAPLETSDFNFNSPRGACPVCQGQGGQPKVQKDLLYFDPEESLSEQVYQIFEEFPKKMAAPFAATWNIFLERHGINENTPTKDIPTKVMNEVLNGSSKDIDLNITIDDELQHIKTKWKGIIPIVESGLQDKKAKVRLIELPFVQWQICPTCEGSRLKPESRACLIHGKSIDKLCSMTTSNLLHEINHWHFDGKQEKIASEILPHIKTRLQFLEQVGLGYLELNRQGSTLSDGEMQRIQLASQIGVKLSGITYILDEPSLGLHKQDVVHLHGVIEELKNLGNTVILVEHEPTLIRHADYIIELGPGAGIHGGELTFQGSFPELLKDNNSLTGQWLSGKLKFTSPPKNKLTKDRLLVKNATLHNIKNLSVEIPLGCLVGFCGVSGSGKSTLVRDIIGDEIQKELKHPHSSTHLQGFSNIKRIVMSQKQLQSFSSRSIPATYVDLMTPIRQLFAETRLAKARGYTPSRFSLNKRGGRCEACEGLGQIRVSMHLMPDIFIPCEVCQGLRFNYETLQVTWEHRNIAEILNLSVEEAYQAFKYVPHLAYKLELMKDLGLEYLTLGQPFNTLSGGEIQRLRLVADLATKSLETTLYILDEPSAGLHFQDIEKLLRILHRLVEKGHSVFVVEHQPSILKQADWLIELGPEGGPGGGKLIFEGTPSKMAKSTTPTGKIIDLY